MVNTDFDWGFSFVNETELATEKKKLEELHTTAEQKFQLLYKLIMPFLTNLKRDPDKPYLLWPGDDRVKKIDAFIERMNQIRDSK